MAAPKPASRGYSTSTLILAWLSGFTIGVLALFVAGILITRSTG